MPRLQDRASLVVHEMGPCDLLSGEDRGCGASKELQEVISAPNVLQRFHSTRRMSSAYEGETVTFLLSVGLRDPQAAQAWGLLLRSCGKVIGLRMRPTRMDRQPIAKVVAERFPPPMQRQQARAAAPQKDQADQETEKEVAPTSVEEGS